MKLRAVRSGEDTAGPKIRTKHPGDSPQTQLGAGSHTVICLVLISNFSHNPFFVLSVRSVAFERGAWIPGLADLQPKNGANNHIIHITDNRNQNVAHRLTMTQPTRRIHKMTDSAVHPTFPFMGS